MNDGFQLIHSDDYGNPAPRSALLHWVRVTINPHPALVNQLTAGGAFPHSDCGEACVESTLRDRGISDPIRTIEHDAGATNGGTSAAMLVRALADVRISAAEYSGTLGVGYVMNPLGGRLIAADAYAPYKAASANQFVAISTPGPWDNDFMSETTAQQIDDLWNAAFSPYGEGGIAKWSNPEVLRRMLAQLGATYNQSSELPFVPMPRPAAPASTPLTAAQSAALLAIPAISAAVASGDLALAHIEAALKAA